MSLFTTTPAFLLDPKRQSPGGNTKANATEVTTSTRTHELSEAFKLLAKNDTGVQSQVDTLFSTLRNPVPLPSSFGLKDPTGRVIAFFGFQESGAAQIYGLSTFDLLGDLAAFVGVQTELPKTITATSNASPDVITIATHGYVNGDTVLISGATGDTAINGIRIVQNVTTNTFTTTDLGGAPINGNGAYGGSGTAERYYGGVYGQVAGFGGTGGFANAKIRTFADGSVLITGATLKIVGTDATILLDGNTGDISVTKADNSIQTIINSAGVVVQSLPGLKPATSIGPGTISVTNSGGHTTFTVQSTGSGGSVTVRDSSGNIIDTLDATGMDIIGTLETKIDLNNAISVKNVATPAIISTLKDTGLVVTAASGALSQVQAALLTAIDSGGVINSGLAQDKLLISSGLNTYISIDSGLISGTNQIQVGLTGTSNLAKIGQGTVTLQDNGGHNTTISYLTITGVDTVGSWSLSCANGLQQAGNKVVGQRRTGWTAWTGTATRTSKATGSATTQNCAEAIKALIDDLIAHGLIGT